MNNSQKWYNNIAKRNKGYKSLATYTKRGLSGEDEFRKKLIALLPGYANVLDIGCGHGEFTLEMANYAKKITGGDNSNELLQIATAMKSEKEVKNAEFRFIDTHDLSEIKGREFDMIYSRRGPTSIYLHKRILKQNGLIISIHPLYAIDRVKERLLKGGFEIVELVEYLDCELVFDTITDFAEHLSSMHMSNDYTLSENKEELSRLVDQHTIEGELIYPEHRFIVVAK